MSYCKTLCYFCKRSIESVENSNNSSQSSVVRRDDVYKKVKKLGAESVKQLLLYESIFTNNHRLFIYYDEDDAFNFLTDQIMLQPNPIVHFDFLVAIKTYGSIPDALLKWFSDDLRAGLYFSSFIKLEAFQDCLYGEAEYLYWIKSIIKVSRLTVEGSISIDINISTDQKLRDANINNIATLKKMYLNNRTRAKILKWLDQTDVEQIEWAYDYLNDRKKIIFEGVFFPKTLSDKYNLILASIDIADDIKEEFTVPNGANELVFTRRGIFIYKMRRAWDSILNTKKRAEQKSKMTITIDQSNFDSLSKLRSHYKLTPTKMLNKLIEDEFSTINDYLKKYT